MTSTASAPEPAQKRILVVDDEPDVLESVAFALEKEGYQVIMAVDGYQGYGAARLEEPDLVILDVMLPHKNGYEVARKLNEDARRGVLRAIPVLILTARKVDSIEREDFLKTWSGAARQLLKPFEMDDLLQSVRDLLEA
jgi:DNA-binding response OmpR family regulator